MPDTLVSKSQDASPVSSQKQIQEQVKSSGGSPLIDGPEASSKVDDSKELSSSPPSKSNLREKPRGQDADEDADGKDDGKAASEKEHAEHLRRKRDREGSLEPSLSSQSTAADLNPSKKNRLQDAAIREEQVASSSAATAAAPASPNLSKGAEGEKVGQIRKRVQDLSWKQRKEGDRDGREEDEVDEEEGDEEAKDVSDSKDAEEEETKPAPEPAPAPVQEEAKAKRTQPSFSSFSSKSSGFAAASAAKDKGDFLSSPPAASDAEKTDNASPSSASRTQPTFSSFSKSSSPFSSASNVAGPSWLAGKSGSTVTSTGPPGASGGIKPSTLGSVGNASDKGSPPAVASAASSSNEAAAKVQSTSGANSAVKNNLGFGAFASSKTFSSKGSSPASTSDKTKDGAEDAEEKTTQGKTFDEVLQQSEDRNGEAAEKPNSKVGSQFDAGHVDLRTGEEDEKTLTSARAKLYTMSEDKNWKERGTGTVRCNVGKEGGGGGRLVMRSEGVLRLILNVNLFKGMKINLEQDKFLRIVAMEDEKLAHFAIKFANQATATNFYRIVKQTIPAEDGDSWA